MSSETIGGYATPEISKRMTPQHLLIKTNKAHPHADTKY